MNRINTGEKPYEKMAYSITFINLFFTIIDREPSNHSIITFCSDKNYCACIKISLLSFVNTEMCELTKLKTISPIGVFHHDINIKIILFMKIHHTL